MVCHACRGDRLARSCILTQEAKRLTEPLVDSVGHPADGEEIVFRRMPWAPRTDEMLPGATEPLCDPGARTGTPASPGIQARRARPEAAV